MGQTVLTIEIKKKEGSTNANQGHRTDIAFFF